MKRIILPMSSALLCFLVSAAIAAPPLPGAIFTTDPFGTIVNGNTKYEDPRDVFLDGGPGMNAPQKAASLPDGDYYFQVTDPSGKHLLSTDPVQNRCVTIADGVIVSNCPTGTHLLNPDQDHGPPAVVVQLWPYSLTPNPGGVFKAWMTPVGDGTIGGGGFVGDPTRVDNGNQQGCGQGCFHGFIPSRSKTDNFKIGEGRTFDLHIQKQIVDKKNLVAGAGWPIFITDPLGATTDAFTDASGFLWLLGLPPGTYTITEATELADGSIYDVVLTEVNGISVEPPTPSVEISGGTKKDLDPQTVRFVNQFVCKGKSCK